MFYESCKTSSLWSKVHLCIFWCIALCLSYCILWNLRSFALLEEYNPLLHDTSDTGKYDVQDWFVRKSFEKWRSKYEKSFTSKSYSQEEVYNVFKSLYWNNSVSLLSDHNEVPLWWRSSSFLSASSKKDEMFWSEKVAKYKEHTSASHLENAHSWFANVYSIEDITIDMNRVAYTWESWLHSLRNQESIDSSISYDSSLDSLAKEWSQFMKTHWWRTHKRFPSSAFYDFNEIRERFLERGYNFDPVAGHVVVENVWEGNLYCTSGDCTDDILRSLKNTFDYFVKEKWQAYTAHFDTMTNSYLTKFSIGIALDTQKNKIYSTMYYMSHVPTYKK